MSLSCSQIKSTCQLLNLSRSNFFKVGKITVRFPTNIFQHKFETFGNTSWTTMTLRREEKLWKKLFLFSTHRARFYLDAHTLVLFFYFVQLVWESWFDGDKRWNGSLGRIRASQASDTEVNVTQGARLTFPYHRPVKKPDFHHLDSRWRPFKLSSLVKTTRLLIFAHLHRLLDHTFQINFSVICESDGTGYSIFLSSIFNLMDRSCTMIILRKDEIFIFTAISSFLEERE